MLQRLEEDTQNMQSSGKIPASEYRIRENLINTLRRKFVEVSKEYSNAQTKYKGAIHKKVERQVRIVKPDATNEEVGN